MEALVKLSSVVGLSLTSGINLYATVAVVGLATKFDMIKGLPPEFQAFDNNLIIILAIVLYLCEFAADKIPAFDSIWDSVHTIIRPFGAALVSLAAVGEADPSVEVAVALLGASLALATHTAKAGTRLVVNTSPEPFSNIGLSLAEDVGVVGMSLLVMSHPLISLAVSLIVLVFLIRFGPGLWRAAILIIRAIPVKLLSGLRGGGEAGLKEFVPDSIEEAIDVETSKDEKVQASMKCFARKVKGCGRNKKGYLVLTDNRLLFAFRKFFRTRVKQWKLADVEKVRLNRKFLLDVLGVKSEGKFLQFIFLKNRSAPAGKLCEVLDEKVGRSDSEAVAPGEAAAGPDTAGA
jgi:hypothetical protein